MNLNGRITALERMATGNGSLRSRPLQPVAWYYRGELVSVWQLGADGGLREYWYSWPPAGRRYERPAWWIHGLREVEHLWDLPGEPVMLYFRQGGCYQAGIPSILWHERDCVFVDELQAAPPPAGWTEPNFSIGADQSLQPPPRDALQALATAGTLALHVYGWSITRRIALFVDGEFVEGGAWYQVGD